MLNRDQQYKHFQKTTHTHDYREQVAICCIPESKVLEAEGIPELMPNRDSSS